MGDYVKVTCTALKYKYKQTLEGVDLIRLAIFLP